jgi:hypothetical protein
MPISLSIPGIRLLTGVLTGAALMLAAAASGAQAIYKCTADGKTSYGDAPCASGASVALAAPPAPAHDDGRSLARQQTVLKQIERERQQSDAREARGQREQARASRVAAVQHKKCATLKLHRDWAAEDAASAPGKTAAAARRKARRAEQKLALECPA